MFQNTTLGGRLYYTQISTSSGKGETSKQETNLKKSANASLCIPDQVEVKVGYNSTKSESTSSELKQINTTDNITWCGVGGNPGLVVEYAFARTT